MSQFYIMKAAHLTSCGRKLGLPKIVKHETDCTIIVGERHYGWGKTSMVNIVGSRGDYGVSPGDKTTYTVDTGNGYRNRGEQLDIHHVLHIADGQLIKVNGRKVEAQPVPVGMTNYTYVMK